jgi:hypothetical protein
MITLYHRGKTYHLGRDKTTWPPEVLALLPQPRDPHLCNFQDRPCPRLEAQHLCGGLPAPRPSQRHYPYWAVFALETDPVPVLPTQQLSFLDPPTKRWRLISSGRIVEHRRWWVAVYHCIAGAEWAASLFKRQGHARVEVAMVNRATPRSRPIVKPVLGCW